MGDTLRGNTGYCGSLCKRMNIPEILKAINDFRGRKFLVVIVIWYLVYIGKADSYWAGSATLIFFLLDSIEKLVLKKGD